MTADAAQGPLFLRVSVTDRCQLRCSYCMPPDGVPLCRHEEILSYEEIFRFVEYLQGQFGVGKVRITGGDPLVRQDIAELIRPLARLRVPDLALTTNGQRLEAHARELKEAGLKRVNISLDSLVPETFARLSGGGSLEKTRRGIEAALEQGLRPVKLNMVVLKGVNDGEIIDLAAFAMSLGCEMRFLELMPLGVASENFERWFVPSETVISRLSETFDLQVLDPQPGETARHFEARDEKGRTGRMGVISPCSVPFCAGCRRLRLTADGHLIGCLGREARVAIRPYLRDGRNAGLEALKPLVQGLLAEKLQEHHFASSMVLGAVGG